MPDNYLEEMKKFYETTLKNSNQKGDGKGILCPNQFSTQKEKPCKLCEICKEILINRDTPRNDPLKEKARVVNAKKKYYSNILMLSNPSEVIVLEYGEKIFNQLIAGQMDDLSEWKNFMHPAQGRNLYITKVKVGTEKWEVDYKVEPRMSISALPDPSVLTRLYDITNIVALIESGKVSPVYQSKFDFSKTEVRFLPSGDRTKPLLFFKQVAWHYKITKEEFEAVQKGNYNPVTGLYTSVTPETARAVRNTTPISNITKPVTSEDLLAEWGVDESTENTSIDLPETEDKFQVEEDVEPMCYGQYDKDNKTCIGTCTNDGWAESCKKIYAEKLALRARAKRISK